MNSLFSRDLCAALVLSFGHFLWIGTLIAVVAAVAVRRQRTAEARYRVWLAALMAMAVSPFVTLVVLQSMPTAVPVAIRAEHSPAEAPPEKRSETDDGRSADERLVNPPLSVDETVSVGGLKRDGMLPDEANTATNGLARPTPSSGESAWWRDYAPLVTSLYLIGVALMGLRLSLGLWGGRRLRRRATPITDASLLAALHRQATALGMTFVPVLAYCERVAVPTVLGILKPMILLPVSLASGLAPDQIESVLAHELAHLRRYDHLVNLMQCVIESVLFFHPAIWWVSRRIRDEREHCCDDLVVACGAVPLDYAASLLRVAELSREVEQQRGHTRRRSFAAVSLFATGDRPSTLRQRIARLLGYQTEMNVRAVHPWLLFCLATCCLGAVWVLTSMTWIVLAEINRDRSHTTVIVEWSAVVDESVMQEIRALIGKTASQSAQPETTDETKSEILRCSADELRSILKSHLGNKRLVTLQKSIQHSMPTGGWQSGPEQRFFQMIESETIRTDEQDDRFHSVNWHADGMTMRDEQPDQARLKVEGTYHFKQDGVVPAKATLKFDEVMSDGEATLVVLTPPTTVQPFNVTVTDRNGSRTETRTKKGWNLYSIFVHEAVRIPAEQIELFKPMTRPEDWVRRGSAGTKAHAARIADWRSRTTQDFATAHNPDWTRELPHGGQIELLGIGHPHRAPFVWWDPTGKPISGDDPNWSDRFPDEWIGIVRVSEAGVDRCPHADGKSNFKLHRIRESQFAKLPMKRAESDEGRITLQVGAGFGPWTSEAKVAPRDGATANVNGLECRITKVFDFSNREFHTHFHWEPARDIDVGVIAITKTGQVVAPYQDPTITSHDIAISVRRAFAFQVPLTEIDHLLIKTRPRQWTEFTGFATEPVVALNPSLNFPKRHIAELPDGLKVEFVGITKNTAPVKDGWKPDGQPIGDVGYWPSTTYRSGNTAGSYIENGEHPKPNAGALDLLFRFRGLKAQPSFRFDLAANGSSYSHLPVKDPYEIRVTTERRIPLPGGNWTIPDGEMRVGLTDEPWGKWLQVSPTGEVLNPLTAGDLYRSNYEQVQIERVEPHERAPNKLALVLRQPKNSSSLYAFEIRGIDTDDKQQWVLEWEGRGVEGTDLNESRWGLASPETKPLVRYEFRLRPYRHWVTFKGVRLEPGKETDVKVSVESLFAVVKFPPPNREDVRGLDLSRAAMLGYSHALQLSPDQQTPELLVPGASPSDPWKQPKNVFQMPLAEHTWLKYPAGSGHFYINHRSDGTWQSEQLYGPIDGDPFELLKLEELFRERLKPGATGGDPRYRLTLMFRTGDPQLIRRAWRWIEPELALKSTDVEKKSSDAESAVRYSDRDEWRSERLESLGRVRAALRDEAEAFRKPELSDVATRMREAVAAAEAVIDALNDSVADETYTSVTYLQPKLAAKIPDALWGQPLDGLRLALVPRDSIDWSEWQQLPLDTPLSPTITVQPVRELSYQLVVENVSDHEVKLCGYVIGEEIARSLEVLDHNGKPVAINSLHTTIPHFPNYWRLKPGERQLLAMPAVHFLPVSHELPNHRSGYSVEAAPGKYTLRCSMWFGNLDNGRHRHVPGKSEWIGKLTTGSHQITVADASPVRQEENSGTASATSDSPAPASSSKDAAKSALRIAGRVLDAETGKPIAKCRMVPTSSDRDDSKQITWQTQYLKEFTDGRFLYETDRPWDKTKLRIEADGYQPATTRAVNKGEIVELDVKLVRKILAGVVRRPNGQPAVKAQLALASWTNEIKVESNKLSYSGHGAKLRKVVETDEQGRFVMPAEVDPCVVVVAHEAGYAEVANAGQSLARKLPVGQDEAQDKPNEEDKPKEDTAVIELQPWGRVEGRVLMGEKPVVGAKYWVYPARNDDVHVQASHNVVTDANGRFVVEQLPPGRFGTCQRYADNSDGQGSHFISGLLVRFDIPAGKTTTLELGGRGRMLIGKLALPEGFPHKVDWSKVSLKVSLQGPRFSGRLGGNDESWQSWSKFLQTEEGKLYGRANVAIAADGSFRIEGLPAAEYDLAVNANGQAVVGEPKPDGEILRGSAKIAIPAVASDAADPVDLGTIDLKSLVALTSEATWGRGEVTNGLRARVVSVPSSMSEDAIGAARRAFAAANAKGDELVSVFSRTEDVAFAVEIENVSDKPIKLPDARDGNGNTDWNGQFLYSVDLFDQSGKLIERPVVQVVDVGRVLHNTGTATLEPGQTHRVLLRPAKWLSPFQQRIVPGRYRAAVRYHGLRPRVAEVAGDIATSTVAFEVSPQPVPEVNPLDPEPAPAKGAELVWGNPTSGLRAAMSFAPQRATYAHGEKPDTKLHVQNVSDKTIMLTSLLWLSELKAAAQNDKGEPVEVGSVSYTGRTMMARVTLKPQQVVIFDAGNVGLAVSRERADKFEHVTHRKLVAPAGKYTMQLEGRFGNSVRLEDGKGNVVVPLPGDYVGELKTGAAPLTIANEIIECDIVDAVTGKPIADTTTSFIFIKPKSADSEETTVAHMVWGPKGPGHISFTIPDQVMQRADREELEVKWGTGNHPDYENYAPVERIPLKQFFKEGPKAARETLSTIKLTPKKKAEAKANGAAQAIKPLLEFRIAANEPEDGWEPGLPNDWEKRNYRDGRLPAGKDHDAGFAWYPLSQPWRSDAAFVVSRSTEGTIEQGNELLNLLSDQPKHVMLMDGSWSVLEAKVVQGKRNPAPGEERGYAINVRLDEAGAKRFAELVSSYRDMSLAVVMNGEIVGKLVLKEPSARLEFGGHFTKEWAEELVRQLNGLPPDPLATPVSFYANLVTLQTVFDKVLPALVERAGRKLSLDTDSFKAAGVGFNKIVTLRATDESLRRALDKIVGASHVKLDYRLSDDGKDLIVFAPPGEKSVGASAPPKGLEFLTPYPKLHGLSLDMTEPQFLEIVKQQELKTRKTGEGDKVQHHIALGDGHTLIVMFDKDAKCSGIQRVRGEDSPGGPPDLRTMREPSFRLPGHSNITGIGFDNNSTELVAVSTYHFATIRRWDLVGMKLKSDITLSSDRHLRPFREGSFKLSGDGRRVIAATDEYVGIWETATGKLLKKLPFPTRDGIYDCWITNLDCTPDLSVIAGNWSMPGRLTLAYDARVMIWDGNSGNLLQTVIVKNGTDLKSIDLSSDGKLLATTNGGGAKVWETSSGKLLRSFPNDNAGRKHSDPEVSHDATHNVWCVQLSPDGKQVAMGDILGVKLLDVASGKLLQLLEGPHRYGLGTLVFSKDGRLLARTGTGDRAEGNKTSYVVPIWSTQTGQKLFELHTESGSGAFSDDSKQFAVGVSDWEMALAVFQLSGSAANTTQLAPESTEDKVGVGTHYRGKKAEEFIDNWKPVWGEPQLGIRYGIALTTPQRQFRAGERVPLVVFFRNVSDKPLKVDTRPDFFGNTPKVVDAKGVTVGFENIPLLGSTPHYVENLEPGEAVGPLYLNFGLGENPHPGQQNWHPYFKTPVAGQYKLTHSVSINVEGLRGGEKSNNVSITSGQIEFEIVRGGTTDNTKLGPGENQTSVAKQSDTFEISGHVTDAQGEPVAKALVVYPYGYDRKAVKPRSVKSETDRAGRFQLTIRKSDIPSDMKLGIHNTVWAWADGYAVGVARVPHLLPNEAGVPPREVKPISIQLPQPVKSVFVANTETGEPLVGATVVPKSVRVPNGSDPIDGYFGLYDWLPDDLVDVTKRVTDADGRVSIDIIPRSQFDELEVVSKSHGTQSIRLSGRAKEETLPMRAVGSLSGRLVGGPAELMRGVRLHFSTSVVGTGGIADVTTDESGSFHVPSIASGSLRIGTNLEPKQPWKLVNADRMTIVAGRENEVLLNLEKAIPATGRLVVRGGVEPVGKADVSIQSGYFKNRDSSVTDEQGEFRTLVVPGHDADIQVINLVGHPDLTYPQQTRTKVTVPHGVDSFRIPDIEIPRAKTWTGRLVDQLDQPVSGKYVQGFSGQTSLGHPTRTDSDGQFKLHLRDDQLCDHWSALIKWNKDAPDGDEYSAAEIVTQSPLVLRIKLSEEQKQSSARPQAEPGNEKAEEEPAVSPTAAELEKQIQLKGRELFFVRMELAQEFETLWPTKDQKLEKVTSKGTVRWLKNTRLTRIDSDRMVPGTGTVKLHPEQWTTGFDGVHGYSWNRAAKLVSYGAMRPGAIGYSPNLLFWGRTAIAYPQPMFGPNPRITRATRDGREVIDVVVDVPVEKGSEHYLGMAPDRGYLPTHVEAWRNGRLVAKTEFQDFFQPHPGVWAPKTIVWTAWSADNDANGKPIVVGRTKTTVTKLELGDDAKLQDEEFKLKLPDDVKVVDAAKANTADEKPGAPVKQEPQKPNDGAKLPGRLFVNAGLRTTQDETRFSQSAIAIDPNTGSWTRLQNFSKSGFTVPLSHVRVSPDGRTMLFMREKELWKCDAATGDRAERVLEKGSPAAWSPDGKTFIAVVETNERDGQLVENRIVSVDGQKQSVLALPKGDAVEDWSADGQWLAVRSRLDSQIYLVKPDGSGRRRLAESVEYSLGHSSFSPDSRRIVYLSRQTLDDKSRFSLRTINIDGTGDREILGEKKAGSEPDTALWTAPMAARWSPDGKHLAVVLFDHTRDGGILAIGGNWRLVIIDADGGNLRELKLEGMLTTVLPWDGPEWRPIAPGRLPGAESPSPPPDGAASSSKTQPESTPPSSKTGVAETDKAATETTNQGVQAEPQTEKSRSPWSVSGRVIDGDGKPMPGVLVTAHTGMGTLMQTGKAETDAEGKYEFRFGPGILLAGNDTQVQVATISAHKLGYFEKNLSRQGDLLAAMKLPEQEVGWGKKTKDDVILPDKPRQIDFVMLPAARFAARLAGTLIDKDDRPLAGYGVSLTGDELPPSSSVIASVKTDEKGRFAIANIPTGFKFQILIEPSKREPPWNAWASGPFDFRISSGDEFFIQQPKREVAANRFELQVIGEGVNWKEALKIGAAHQKLEPTGDYLTTESRLHAATIRLTLNPPANEPKDDQARRGGETGAVQRPNIVPLEWGKELNGLRTRVTLLTEKPAVGQPLRVKIELQNVGRAERTYQSQRADPDYLLDVVGPDGKPAEFIKGGSGIPVQALKIKPDETIVLWEDVDVASMYLLANPDRYEIKLRGPDKFDVDAAGPERAHPNPASNALAVTLADGTLNDIQATFVRIRNIAPKDWGISTRGNSISNIQKSITRRGEFLLMFTKERQADDFKLGGTIPYEYLGLTRLGHAYLAVNPQAKTEWPECVQKIREQLPPADNATGEWGRELNGLRTRLTLLTEKSAVGQPLQVKIELQNVGQVERKYQTQRANPDYLLEVVGPDGKPAEFINGPLQVQVSSAKIKPGETIVLWEAIDVASMILLPKSGRYEIKLRGSDSFDVDETNPEQDHPYPTSNTLSVTLAEGMLNDIQATFVGVRNIAPKDWQVSTRDNSILLLSPNFRKGGVGRGIIHLVFTKEQKTDEQKLLGTVQYEYLGLTTLGHAYVAASAETKTEWPECVEKIRAQLPSK